MWLLLAGLAHAGIRSDLYALAAEGPDVGVACSSMRGAIAQFESFSDAMAGEVPLPLTALFRGRLGDLLRETDGPFRMGVWTESRVVRLDMDTEEGAEVLAGKLATFSGGVAIPEGVGWAVQTAGGATFHLKVDAGRMTLSNQIETPRMEQRVPRTVVEALPEADGCAVLFHGPAADLGPIDLGAHFAFEAHRPMHFVVSSEKLHALDGVVFRPRIPAEVRTETLPEAVVVLGVGLDGINFSRFLSGKGLTRARRLQRQLPVTAGATIGVLQTTPTPAYGISLPMARAIPAHRLLRRTRRVLDALDMTITPRDALHVAADLGMDHLEIAAEDGRLLLASDAATLHAMEANQGAPWVTEAVGRLAAEYPLVLVSSVLPEGTATRTTRLKEPAVLALALEPGLLRGQLSMPLTLGELSKLMGTVKQAPKGLLKNRRHPPQPDEQDADRPTEE